MPPSCGRRNNRRYRGVLAGLMVMLAAASALAETLLTGRPQQGGLMLGRAPAGAAVTLDGRPVPVAADGAFLLGFGRDALPQARLEVMAEGRVESRILEVAPRPWAVQRIKGLPRDKAEPDPAAIARIRTESEMMRALRAKPGPGTDFLGGFIRPAEGVVSGVFGSQRVYNGSPGAPHSGLDIAAPKGQPILAAADGVVVLAAPDLFLTGQTVAIDHGLGLISSYAHLSRLDVAVGRRVARGEVIGAMGATGLATGSHLHWGVSWLEVRLDPEAALALLAPR